MHSLLLQVCCFSQGWILPNCVTASLHIWTALNRSGRHPDGFKTGMDRAQQVWTALKRAAGFKVVPNIYSYCTYSKRWAVYVSILLASVSEPT